MGGLPRVAVGATLYALRLEAISGPLLRDVIGQPDAVTPLRILALGIPFSALTDILVAALKARQTVLESSAILQFSAPVRDSAWHSWHGRSAGASRRSRSPS